jgi:hypothetical protein
MLTWFRLWPLLALPVLLLFLLISLPMFEVRHQLLGGPLVRQWLLNHGLLPLLPDTQAQQVIQWFSGASVLQEWLLTFLIALNINALLLLPLFFVGQLIIRFSAWTVRTELNIKRQSVR